MKKLLWCFGVCAMALCAAHVPGAFGAEKQTDPSKEEVLANVKVLQDQEIRVLVLKQLLERESAGLVQLQAVFSDRYQLDPEKLRKGLYTYNQAAGKFEEKKTQK